MSTESAPILVVDNEHNMLALFQRVLGSEGYQDESGVNIPCSIFFGGETQNADVADLLTLAHYETTSRYARLRPS